MGLPSTLHRLELVIWNQSDRDLTPVYPSWAFVEELELTVTTLTTLGSIALPKLRLLSLKFSQEADASCLMRGHLPSLEELRLDAPLDAVVAFFATSEGCPRLHARARRRVDRLGAGDRRGAR